MMEKPFPPFDPDGDQANARTRFRDISLRAIFPTLLTLLAICSGLTSIRFSVEGRFELAVAAIILAAMLDGLDGRVARFLKSASRFGEQVDSLADFVNFGVAPAMLIYFAITREVTSIGWITALIYAICACMRLARFNVMIDKRDRPAWQAAYFVGVPAPAGAMTVMIPVYLSLLGIPPGSLFATATALYTVAVGLLMVSSLPTFSGKVGGRVSRDYVLPLMLALVVTVALLLSYPWLTLLLFSLAYLASLLVSRRSWSARLAKERTVAANAAKNAAGTPPSSA